MTFSEDLSDVYLSFAGIHRVVLSVLLILMVSLMMY